MNKLLLLISFVGLTFTYGQNSIDTEILIQKINSQEEADIAQLKYKSLSIRRITQTPDNYDFPSEILLANIGETIQLDDKIYYRLLSKSITKEFKVKYIFLDGEKFSISELEELKKKIKSDYNSGISFAILADKYSMDPRKNGGDLGWFPEGRMVKPFEDAIKAHKKGEFFTAEFSPRNWHFLIFKNHNDRQTGELEYIEIKPLNYVMKVDDKLGFKQISVSISFKIKKRGELTNIYIREINCINCSSNDNINSRLDSIITTCYERIKKIVVNNLIETDKTHVRKFDFRLE